MSQKFLYEFVQKAPTARRKLKSKARRIKNTASFAFEFEAPQEALFQQTKEKIALQQHRSHSLSHPHILPQPHALHFPRGA